jgi:hypothetical protein
MSRYDWGKRNPEIDHLRGVISAARDKVVGHPIYGSLNTLEDINRFTENHVFAVWDFMSLLKNLQRRLTCVDVPWVPIGSSESRRLINDIVLVEESDALGTGFTSHFELYVSGMEKAGADTSKVHNFLASLQVGSTVYDALVDASVPEPAAAFVSTTFEFIEEAPLHCQAAAFAFGREDLIPEMFEQIIKIDDREGELSVFRDYLARHIEVDGEEHTPMAMAMLADLCGEDRTHWDQCREAVSKAMSARMRLWDGILRELERPMSAVLPPHAHRRVAGP